MGSLVILTKRSVTTNLEKLVYKGRQVSHKVVRATVNKWISAISLIPSSAEGVARHLLEVARQQLVHVVDKEGLNEATTFALTLIAISIWPALEEKRRSRSATSKPAQPAVAMASNQDQRSDHVEPVVGKAQ
jgi:hypothetical protein